MTRQQRYAAMRARIGAGVASGLFEPAGVDADGEPLFRLTEAGEDFVRVKITEERGAR